MKIAFFLVGSLVLAGCVSGEGKDASSPEPSSNVSAGGQIEDAGTLRGLVIDDQNAPVPGVLIGLQDVEVTATTDDGGAFTIENLPAGEYTLFAQRLGYKAASQKVTVLALETTETTVALEPLPVAEAHHEVNTKAAQIDAAFGWSIGGDSGHGCIYPAVTCQSVASAPNHMFKTKDPDETPLAAIVFEAAWTANSAVCAKTLRLRLFSPGEGTNPSDTNEGHWTNDPHPSWTITSPVVMRIPRADDGTKDAIDAPHRIELNDGEPLDVSGEWIGRTFPPGRGLTNTPVDFNCFTQQRIDLWFTHFYMEPGPSDYSARPDA